MNFKTTYGVVLALAALNCNVVHATAPVAAGTLQATSAIAGIAHSGENLDRQALLFMDNAMDNDVGAACMAYPAELLRTMGGIENVFTFTACTDAGYGSATAMKIAAPAASERQAEQVTAVLPVPEPETFIMFLAGLGAIGLIGYRKESASPWAATKVDPTLVEPEQPVEPKSD